MGDAMTIAYERIVFLHGDDANELIDRLYNRESPDSVVYSGVTASRVTTTIDYLSQWDYGETLERHANPSSGTADDVWERARNGVRYRLSANLSLGYLGLERIVDVSRPVRTSKTIG